jgi:uncharacterized membrane protein YoaK (UPF0700 family)
MFGSLYLGALAMAVLLGAVQWLAGDSALDPPRTTIARVAWAGFFAGVSGVGLLGITLFGVAPSMTALAAGVVLAAVTGAVATSHIRRQPSQKDEGDLPEESTIEVDSSTPDSAEPT